MAVLKSNSYGKSQVRLTKVTRHGTRHELKEMSVDVRLERDFARCYTHGDNSDIVATDSMKNTVYVLAKDHPLESIEDFARSLATHFVKTYSQVSMATVIISQVPWQRIMLEGKPHDHAFVGGTTERRTCMVTSTRDSIAVASGIEDLCILKTTRSGFVGFVKDQYTTLQDTTERIFATSVSANWDNTRLDVNWNDSYETARRTMLEVFAAHDSQAVQQTLYAMGDAVLAKCPQISQITLTMPNQHRLLVDLAPFKRQNPNEIFVPTSEPYGLISGTVARS